MLNRTSCSGRSCGTSSASREYPRPLARSRYLSPCSGSFFQTQGPIYFDREEVKRAIHAPVNVTWEECSDINVFVGRGGDRSLPPAFTVLPSIIEKSERAVIVHGLADFILIAEGTRIVIQKCVLGVCGGPVGRTVLTCPCFARGGKKYDMCVKLSRGARCGREAD